MTEPADGGALPLLTIEELRATTETLVRVPALSEAAGRDRHVRARKVARAEWLAMLPPSPPGSASWPLEEWADRERAWVASLSHDELAARRQAVREATCQLVALAVLEPALTRADAMRLADDADVIARAVLRFSGLVADVAEREAPPAAADEAPPAADAA